MEDPENRKQKPFKWAWEDAVLEDQDLETSERFIASILRKWMDKEGWRSRPHQKTIARLTGYNPQTVKRGLRALERAGWIERRKLFGSRGLQTGNLYIPRIPPSPVAEIPSSPVAEIPPKEPVEEPGKIQEEHPATDRRERVAEKIREFLNAVCRPAARARVDVDGLTEEFLERFADIESLVWEIGDAAAHYEGKGENVRSPKAALVTWLKNVQRRHEKSRKMVRGTHGSAPADAPLDVDPGPSIPIRNDEDEEPGPPTGWPIGLRRSAARRQPEKYGHLFDDEERPVWLGPDDEYLPPPDDTDAVAPDADEKVTPEPEAVTAP